MKTKIVYLVSLLCALTFATSAFADSESGFYEKDHIRGFISIGADYRGMFSNFHEYVNTVGRYNGGFVLDNEETGKEETYSSSISYAEFNDWYIGLHMNVGAQYKQFLTWIDFNFMPSQVSECKTCHYGVSTPSEVKNLPKGSKLVGSSQTSFPLYDVEWFAYGADWMFGWKLFGENAPINLIPSIGFGFSLMNMHFSSNYDYVERGNEENVQTLRDRFYSTLATTVNSELELRIELGRLALGGYLGYRFVRYNDMNHEEFNQSFGNHSTHHTDNVGDTYFFGIRATWYFLSQWEKKQQDKL